MTEQEKQESQKTVVAFVAGLLIGGLLVWVFSADPHDKKDKMNDEKQATEQVTEEQPETPTEEAVDTPAPQAELVTGEGKVSLGGQKSGSVVTLGEVTYPLEDGWIAVRTYSDEKLGSILGASRFSKSQGLVPETIQLLAPTSAGRDYAIVFFTENGDRTFNLATDSQVEGVFATFTAE
jgi:hypothetical protein